MTTAHRPVRLLASVTDEAEARLALTLGADIIDCKDPSRGALGELAHETVKRIVTAIAGAVPVSATVGDLPADAAVLAPATRAMAATGVDFVKIGFFPGGDARAAIRALGNLDLGHCRLVGLLLADREPDLGLVDEIAGAGFAGVMLDTAEKGSGALPDHLTASRLAGFIGRAHSHGMLAGLAGSLRLRHIARMLSLQPDILGFRGALCAGAARTGRIEPHAMRSIRAAVPSVASAAGTITLAEAHAP